MTTKDNLPFEIALSMNAHHRRTLMHIFQHPVTHNLTFREVTGLIDAIGTVELKHNGNTVLSVGDEQISIQRPQDKDLTTDDIVAVRHFLLRAGCSPDAALQAQDT